MNEQRSNWNIRLLYKYFWPHDAEAVRGIKIPAHKPDDILAWHYEKSGMFTVRSAYKLAIQLDFNHNGCPANSEMPTGARPIWKSIWKLSVPQKVKLFIWNVAA
jgi:hypothetical protein